MRQRPAGGGPGRLAVVDRRNAIDEEFLHPFRQHRRMDIIRLGHIAARIEHQHVSKVAGLEIAAPVELEDIGGQSAGMADEEGGVDHMLLFHIDRIFGLEGRIFARMTGTAI